MDRTPPPVPPRNYLMWAILSIIAGIVVLFAPIWGVAILWWILGISLVVLGIINIVRAFTFKGDI